MRHHKYNPNFEFVVEPEDFNKYSDKELLQYCLVQRCICPEPRIFHRRF